MENFKYLGAWTQSTEKDFAVRKALAWRACHKFRKVWSSKISRKIKVRLFLTTIEWVLLYGSEAWTLTKKLTKQLDGCCTRMLSMALNVSWKVHLTNEQLYGEFPKVQQRRMRHASHCIRHTEEMVNRLVLWKPTEDWNR